MSVALGDSRYEWIDRWAAPPDPEDFRRSWPHSAIVSSRTDELWTFHPSKRELISFDPSGRHLRSVACPLEEAHGITLAEESGAEVLWLADASVRRQAESGFSPRADTHSSSVIKMDLSGQVLLSLPTPPHPAYREGEYRPTWVGVSEPRYGGNGDVWVADGYGQSLVHRFSSDGKYLGSIDGEPGGGRFRGPHCVFLDHRGREPEFYVTDRSNSRIQVYDLDGKFRRTVGEGTLSSPTSLAIDGDRLLVLEFRPPRLLALDRNDRLVAIAGENLEPLGQPGFPFVRDENGEPTTPKRLRPEKFGVPHGMAIDSEGSLFFTQVVFGSEFTKLKRRR